MFKKITRVFTSKRWRGHKRRIFFQEIFKPLKDREDLEYGSFSLIDDSFSSYKTSCHELAAIYDFFPLDKKYEMNIGRTFSIYNLQRYDYLVVAIERISSSWKTILLGSGLYRVFVKGEENKTDFSFSYDKQMKIF